MGSLGSFDDSKFKCEKCEKYFDKEENHSLRFEFVKNKICKTCLFRIWEEKVIEGKYVLFGPYSEYISAEHLFEHQLYYQE